jgi:prephenate dehydrogenase
LKRIEKLVVVGTGLIGGSFALALREANAVGTVTGIGRRPETLAEARRLGVIDTAADGYACVADADLVMLAMPVGQTEGVLREVARHLGPRTVVTDAGSTKCDVVAAARRTLGAAFPRFVPGHPVAGTEHSGPSAAFPTLYRDRRVVLTPVSETDSGCVESVKMAWQACGARVSSLTPEVHDRVLATVSHLPHLLAFALVDQVSRAENADELFSYAAGGFRDFTRIASSHPEMWRDICLANRTAVLAELTRYEQELKLLRRALEAGDASEVESIFARAREARNRWLNTTATGKS